MKILFYSSFFYPYTSGITTYPFKILSFLAKKHQITVLTFNYKYNQKEEESINNFKIIRMPYFIKLYKGFISPQSLFFFLQEIKKNDLIIINLPNIEGLPLTLIAKLYGKKVISIFHCYLGLSNNFYLRLINYITNKIITLQLILSNEIISYTKDYINNLPLSTKIKNKTKTILPPILKLSVSKKKLDQLLKLKGKNIWIGYAGRISNEKGLEYLIEAISKIKNQKSKIEAVFAGPYGKNVVGENAYYKKIVNLLNQKRIRYRFFSNLSNGDLGAFYKSIDLLVLPSINQTEAFGMVQVEAMLLGVPVVASNLPGVRIPIKLTKMGILTQPKNTLQLAKAIQDLLKNKPNYSNKKLLLKAKKIFNINKIYKFYDDLIEQNKLKLTSEVG